MFGKRILLLVPHPDDEIVACAATIALAQKEGAAIFALYLTHGCIARDALWPWQYNKYEMFCARRHAEAEKVAAQLSITPVSWSQRPARHLWRELPKTFAEITKAIDQNAIDQIWIPAYEGGNADHDALNALGSLLRKKVTVLEFAEYNFAEGRKHSQEFPAPNNTEQVLYLTPDEQHQKRALLALYKSEKRNLNYVDVRRETYRPLAAYDYSKPPHSGTLWYTRFQWVPFRHPGVDFTLAEDVCRAIVKFIKSRS